ncbi:hypothetical protein [Tsukamurella hominis]|uniref:hypothetical protein n=1 Tax=Tsukamurella hominis TaxID=1970232 RepID=UPI0039EAAC70
MSTEPALGFRHLRLVPQLGAYESVAGAIGPTQVGQTVAVRKQVLVVGTLEGVSESVIKPWVILQVGSGFDRQKLVLHPADIVTVIPKGGRVSVTVIEGEPDEG